MSGLRLLFLIAASCNYLHAADAPLVETINVAVIDLESEAVSGPEASSITNELRSNIIKIARFNVIERSRMNEIMAEQGLQSSDMCNSEECYVEMGQIMGVEKLIVGNIGKVGGIFILSIRMIDVKSGKIIIDISEKYKGTIEDVLMVLVPQITEKLEQEVSGKDIKQEIGTISITSNVKGAGVFIDGTFIGTAPITKKSVASGSHTIRVARGGYIAATSKVTFGTKREHKELEIVLRPKQMTDALWRSALVPGWGQLYYEQKKRAMIVGGVQAASLAAFLGTYMMASNSLQEYHDAVALYDAGETGDDFEGYRTDVEDKTEKFKSAQRLAVVSGVICAICWAGNIADAVFMGPHDGGGNTPAGMGFAVEPGVNNLALMLELRY